MDRTASSCCRVLRALPVSKARASTLNSAVPEPTCVSAYLSVGNTYSANGKTLLVFTESNLSREKGIVTSGEYA